MLNINKMQRELVRVGITGAKVYENKLRIKNFIFDLQKQTDSDIVVVSLGDQYGADKYVKKFALEFGYKYEECNASYTQQNLYSILSESHYGKPYTPKSIHIRDRIFCSYVDKCIAFDNTEMSDTKIVNLVRAFKRANKQIIVVS